MIKMFVALGWTKDTSDGTVVAENVMSWLDRKHWKDLNQTFAGLGQLLNKKEEKYKVKEALLELPEGKEWMQVPIRNLLQQYKL